MLDNIKKNFERLIALYETQKQQNEELRGKLETLEAENDTLNKQITELKRQVDNLKLTDAFMVPADSPDGAEEKIEKLIREIDRCISLLEN